MKCDPTSVTIVTAAFIPVAGALFCIRRKPIQIFAVFLAAIAVLDLVVMWSGVGGVLWWFMHFPSAIALGVDEIMETHGVLVSTAAHTADLVLWAALLSVPIALRAHRLKKKHEHSPFQER